MESDSYRLLQDISNKLDKINTDITTVKVNLGKIDAYNIPSIKTQADSNTDRLSRLETKVHMFAAFAGFVGILLGTLSTTIFKGIGKWLS